MEGKSGLLGYFPLMRHQICTTDRSCYNACVSNISTPLGFFPCGKQRNAPHSVTIWRLFLDRPLYCVGLGINAVVFLAAFSCSFTDTAREKEKTILGSQISNRSPAPDSSKPDVQYITTGSLPPSRTSDAMPDPWDSKTAWHSKGVKQC